MEQEYIFSKLIYFLTKQIFEMLYLYGFYSEQICIIKEKYDT